MNRRHFFGWLMVVVLIAIESAGMVCLALALRNDNNAWKRYKSNQALRLEEEEVTEIAPQVQALDTVSLIVAGDAMMHMPQLAPALQADGTYNFDECFRYVAPVIAPYDIRVVNLETTLPGKNYSGYPCFGSPDAFLYGLQNAGFDTYLMANNHCCDKRLQGILRTLEVLNKAHLAHVGVYSDSADFKAHCPLILERKGVRFALINFTYGTNGIPVPAGCVVNGIDTLQILRQINKAKKQNPDVIIALPHWGIEYVREPRPAQRELAAWLLAHGVDHIIGGHPHVIEPVEEVVDTINSTSHVVAYSLGNFISSQSQHERSTSLLVGLKWVKDRDGLRFVGREVIQTWLSRPGISGHKQARIYPMDYPLDSLNAEERAFRQACAAFAVE